MHKYQLKLKKVSVKEIFNLQKRDCLPEFVLNFYVKCTGPPKNTLCWTLIIQKYFEPLVYIAESISEPVPLQFPFSTIIMSK